MYHRLVVVGFCVIAAACAGASHGSSSSQRATCALSPSDSVLAGGRPLYRDCSVDRPARQLNVGAARPNFHTADMGSACYSADLLFVVDSAGRPESSTVQVVRTTDRAFADAVVETVPLWRYEPAIRSGVRVRQIVTTHQAIASVVVAVPAGSPPPSRPPLNMPRC